MLLALICRPEVTSVAKMTKPVVRALLSAGLCTIAACVSTELSSGTAGELNELRSIERQRLRALVTADSPALDRLHSDDFQAISPFGHSFAKEEYLRRVTSGELDYVRWEPEDIQVRLHGPVAALRYKATADVRSGGKLLPSMQTWNTALYERRKGQWIIVWFQVTQISPRPR